jgi:hypothetical protein
MVRTSPHDKNGLNLRPVPDSRFGQRKDRKNASERGIVMIRLSFANSRNFVYRLNETMFFDNLPLEMTCSKCGKEIKETVKWLKAESRKCPFCGTLIDTTEFRRGIDEATNRTHEMLRNLQESLRSIKIRIKL